VQGNAAINPRAVVAGEQEVRQGWENKAEGAQVVTEQATRIEWQVIYLQASDEKFCQLCARQRIHPRTQLGHHTHTNMIPADPVIQNPGPCLGDIQGFSQQLVDVEHLASAGAHQLDEHIVILLRLLDPEYVVEQECIAVAGRQSAVGQSRPANNNLPKNTGFRMNAQFIVSHAKLLFGQPLQKGTNADYQRNEQGKSQQQRPDENQPAVIGNPCDRQATNHHRKGRVDQVDQSVGRLEGSDHQIPVYVGEVRQRRKDGHRQYGKPGGRRHEEAHAYLNPEHQVNKGKFR